MKKPQPISLEKLVARLTQYKAAYYNDSPLVSDAAYDGLEDQLRALDPKHPFFAAVGAPVAAVTQWEKAKHAMPMGSLNKAVTEEEFRKWAARCDALAVAQKREPISGNLLVTEKLDGLSLAVTYERGELKHAITRGDGEVGERITPNAARMKGVPKKLKEKVSLTVRGEIILKLSDLERAFPGASNPRNQAAGTSKRFDGSGCEHLTVLFYDLDGESHATETAKFERLKALAFETPFAAAVDLEGAIAVHQGYAKKKRAALDYEIDGLVMRANDVKTHLLLGDVNNRPRGAVAFKFASQARVTKVVDLIWDTGSSGRVSPIAVVAPVVIAGATVQRASLANAARVAELGIGIGDEVLVSRRNDVIPYVEEVVAKHGPTLKAPTKCAVCGSKLVKQGEYLHCRNDACRALVEGRIQNWVDAQDVHEWGAALIAQLVEAKLVKEPADLYRLKPEQIAALEGRGLIIATKVLKNLKAQLPLSLPKFLESLGIENFGAQTAKALVAAGFDTLARVRAATQEELSVLPGVGPAKGAAVVEGLRKRAKEIERLLKVGVVPVAKKKVTGPLEGLTFCFTGALSKPRKQYEQLVEARGGTLLGGVTKDLNYLVMADPSSGSSKAAKAAKLGTKCIDEETFVELAG